MQIKDFLSILRQRLRKSILYEGLSRVAVLLLLTAIALFYLDYSFQLPSFLRLLILCAYVFVVFDTVYLRLWRPLHSDMSDDQLISLLERKIPELNGRAFVAYDDLPLTEREQQALQSLLDDSLAHRVVPAPYMLRWLMSSGTVIALTLILVVWKTSFFQVAVQRLFLPLSESEWERSTVIIGELEGGEVVAEDQPFVFSFKRIKGEPNPLEVEWRNQDGVEGHKVFDGINSNWRQVLQLPKGTYQFKVSSGDSKAVDLTGTVVERPQLAAIEAKVVPPAYVGEQGESVESLDVSVLPGSTIEYTFRFKQQAGRSIDDIEVKSNDQDVETQISDHAVSGSLQISKEQRITVHAADQNKIGIKPEPTYVIKTLSDHVPQIQLSGPRRSEKVLLQAEVALRIDARDDYGIERVGLDMRREPKKGESVLVDLNAYAYETYRKDTSERYVLRVVEYASENDRLVVKSSATDANNVTGPGVGQSNEIELLVVTEQELRRDLQRSIGEARERVQQGRDALMPAMSDEEKVKQHARQAASLSQKATEQLSNVLRRWKQNKLPGAEMNSVNAAQELLKQQAQPNLMKADTIAQARKADATLAKAYRLLSSAVNNSDLPHELASLIEQQKDLSKQSREFVLKYSVAEMDESAKNAQSALSDRQQELSNQLREWEQRLNDSSDPRYSKAKALAKSERPASKLSQASKQLASNDQRQQATTQQQQATQAMEQMYKMLQGMSGEGSMSEQIGELAQRQQELADQLQAGEQGKAQQKEQRKLAELTKRLLDQLKRKTNKSKPEQQAQKHMAGAQDAQNSASKAMQRGDNQQSQTDATTAAKLLKRAQQALDQEEEQQEEEDQLKILAMLKEMRKEQVEVVSEAMDIDRNMKPDQKINFRLKRQIASIDAVEKKMLGKLREEAIPALKEAKMQIAIWGLKRLDAALLRTHEHLSKPALGKRGVELTKVVLREIDRLIAVVSKMPKPKTNQEGDGGGGGGGGGSSPFPPLAELNMLAQAQELILHYTMARYGERLPADQRELNEMIKQMTQNSRPGSRPRVLLERTKRAMGLATEQLFKDDLGVATQHHQRLAVLTLQQLMREAKRQQGSNSKGKKDPQSSQNQDQQQGSSKPNQGQSGNSSSSQQSSSNAQAQQELKNASAAVKAIVEQKGMEWYLNLPPKVRQSLIEVNVESLPAGARELYHRYLEILEDVEQ